MKWYFQSRRKLSLFHCSFALEVISGTPLHKVLGDQYRDVYLVYHNGQYESYLDMPSVQRLWKRSVALILGNPGFLRARIQELDDVGKRFVAHATTLTPAWCARATTRELCRAWRLYNMLYTRLYATYVIAAIADRPMLEWVRRELHEAGHSDRDATTIITALTTLGARGFVGAEQRALKQLAGIIRSNPQWLRAIKRSSFVTLQQRPTLYRHIYTHLKRWHWVPHDLEGQSWTFDDIVDRLRHILSEHRITNSGQHIRLPIFSKEIYAHCRILRDLIYIRERRKLYMSKACVAAEPFLDELAKRLGVERKVFKMLVAGEVENALKQGRINVQQLEGRHERAIAHARAGRISWTGHKDLDRLEGRLRAQSNRQEHQRVFHGVPASPGCIEGTARLVHTPSDYVKVMRGDIVIALNTTPEYIAALSRASGLVADDSATITCHAATVAREFGIPCVVGTRSVMEYVHDGDRIRLDANKGEVIILRKNRRT